MNRVCTIWTTALIVAGLAAPATAQSRNWLPLSSRSPSDGRALEAIFGEEHLAENVHTMRLRAARMPPSEQYEYLTNWVLPSRDHASLRLALDFTATNPPPPNSRLHPVDAERLEWARTNGKSRIQTGGHLVSPAIDLIEVAARLDRLDEVRLRIDDAPANNSAQKRSRLAMLVLVDIARRDFATAFENLDQLMSLVRVDEQTVFADWRAETLAVWQGIRRPETREAATELLFSILQNQVRPGNRPSGCLAWDHLIAALPGEAAHFATQEAADKSDNDSHAGPSFENWAPVSRATAWSQGLGMPSARWQRSQDGVENLSGHNEDYLYYRIPLRGNFQVECDVTSFGWRDSHLAVAGRWVAPRYDTRAYSVGDFRRELHSGVLDPRMSEVDKWIRYRSVVRDGVCTTYLNGRPIHRERLPEQHDPWVAVRSPWYATGAAREFRVTGQPQIPDQVVLSTLPDLTGWISYFAESVGGRPAEWRHDGTLAGGGIVGHRRPELHGSGTESLLHYHRPMLEDGTIDYEFFYREGKSLTHPALDRLVFLLDPQCVRIHWATDGIYDRAGADPWNVTDEPGNRRGPDRLPLKPNDWNQLRLTLRGDTVELLLNDQPIYERTLEPGNQRTFGLFHYADQTEARVRNVVWRGDWPRVLPATPQQELAKSATDVVDEGLSRLTAVFRHDFAADGLPLDQFVVRGEGWQERFVAKPDGLHVSRPGVKGYVNYWFAPRMRIHGDFDIIAGFDQLTIEKTKDGSGAILLTTVMENDTFTHGSVYRGMLFHPGSENRQIIQSEFIRRVDDKSRISWFGATAEEATSGRLRLARRGDTLYCLFAEHDSPNFRLVHTQTVVRDKLLLDGVRFATAAHSMTDETGSTSVVWKDLTIRAERITDAPITNSEKLLEDLNRQRDALAASFRHDFANDPPTVERFGRWGTIGEWQPNEKGLRIVAPGSDEWQSSGIEVHRGLRGDFDVAVAFETPVFDKPKEGGNSAVFLQVAFPGNPPTNPDAILIQQPDGSKKVVAELMTPTKDGNKFQWLRTQSVESAARLRIARRGKSLLFLFAEDATKPFQVLTQTELSDEEIPISSIRVFAHTGGAGRETQVLCKTIELHAEEIVERTR